MESMHITPLAQALVSGGSHDAGPAHWVPICDAGICACTAPSEAASIPLGRASFRGPCCLGCRTPSQRTVSRRQLPAAEHLAPAQEPPTPPALPHTLYSWTTPEAYTRMPHPCTGFAD